jgi:rRNA-processing protein FCF1
LTRESKAAYIIDANALIDYCDSDLQMLSIFSQKIGSVYIARSAFDKVEQLNATSAKKHHLLVEVPDLETIVAAAADRGSLAPDDKETLVLAKRNGWVCITNDKPLRRECESEGVACLWGLEPMRMLVESGAISPSKAISVVKTIKMANPGFISDEIVDRFEKRVKKIQTKKEK